MVRQQLFLAMLLSLLGVGCGTNRADLPSSYVFLWAGDSAGVASDFLAVIDADPRSAQYGRIVASLPTGAAGTHPHHTEAEMPADGHLLANGFATGQSWLFDLSEPVRPRILTTFGDLAGLSHPHTYVRLTSGNVLATFQYAAGAHAPAHDGMRHDSAASTVNATGGLVEMNERGQIIRSRSARDTTIADPYIYPYSVLPLPSIDRALSTTTDMDESNTRSTARWLQLWKLSDLSLLGSIALPPGHRGDENQFTGEPRLLPDGHSVYVHTFNCGLYLVRGLDQPQPSIRFVWSFEGRNCGVPVLADHYWLQTVPEAHALVSLDITDPEQPRQVSMVTFGDDEAPHWAAIDPSGTRVVLNSGGGGRGNRLFIVTIDTLTGALEVDPRFKEVGSDRPGIELTDKVFPHGFRGRPVPHGAVFSR